MNYESLRVWDTRRGDVVRRIGHPLRIGVVIGMTGEQLMVQWADTPTHADIRWHHYLDLERRLDGTIHARSVVDSTTKAY